MLLTHKYTNAREKKEDDKLHFPSVYRDAHKINGTGV